MRRPHVFISSRLTYASLRKEIRSLLQDVGFSVEIYESDSTPSFEPATYLKDIEQADFVVFILDKTYGTPRPSTGRSGIHEEWNIVRTKKIPNHVYLQKVSKSVESKQKKFIKEELIDREISYFYYKNEADLREQLKRSIVRMALEIGKSPSYRTHLSMRALAAEVAKRDHQMFFAWDKAIRTLVELEDTGNLMATGWAHISDIYTPFNPISLHPFTDGEAQRVFASFLHKNETLAHYESSHVVGYDAELSPFPFPFEPVALHKLHPEPPIPADYFEKRLRLRGETISAWEEVGKYVLERYSRFSQY